MASVTSSEAGQHGPKFDIEKGSAADQPTAPPNDPEPEYPSAKKAAVVMLAAGLAMFLVALVSNRFFPSPISGVIYGQRVRVQVADNKSRIAW